MRVVALFLICCFLLSCIAASPQAEAKKRMVYLREIAKEDKRRMKKLKHLANVYKLRGKRSRKALKDFTEGCITYLDFLMANTPVVRGHLSWLEQNKYPVNIRLSLYLTGGRNKGVREKNEAKGIYDPRMYKKRKKNLESRLKKKEPVSFNEIKNIKYPL